MPLQVRVLPQIQGLHSNQLFLGLRCIRLYQGHREHQWDLRLKYLSLKLQEVPRGQTYRRHLGHQEHLPVLVHHRYQLVQRIQEFHLYQGHLWVRLVLNLLDQLDPLVRVHRSYRSILVLRELQVRLLVQVVQPTKIDGDRNFPIVLDFHLLLD